MFAPIPRMTRIALSRNLGIPTFGGNPIAVVTCHLFCLIGSLGQTLALMAEASSLKHSSSRSLLPLSRTRRRLILSLLTITRSSDTPCILYLSLSMVIAVLTIESMSCRRSPTIFPRIDNCNPFSNFLTLSIIVAT